MGDMTAADLAKAAAKLDRGQEAKCLINEAGKGLMDVFNAAARNTVTLADVAKLQVAQGYLTEAAVLLLESVALMEKPNPPEVREGTELIRLLDEHDDADPNDEE